MERQFLAASLFLLLALSSCQSNPSIENSMDAKCKSSALDSGCDKNVVISVEEPQPIAKNIWEYMIIHNNYDNDIAFDKKTLGYINNHLKDVDKFNEFLGKSYYFIYYVIQELEAADLPTELALIPFVESNYDPFSISPSGAVGLWQFMPQTAKIYGLKSQFDGSFLHGPHFQPPGESIFHKYCTKNYF